MLLNVCVHVYCAYKLTFPAFSGNCIFFFFYEAVCHVPKILQKGSCTKGMIIMRPCWIVPGLIEDLCF